MTHEACYRNVNFKLSTFQGYLIFLMAGRWITGIHKMH